jgi:hypothetical protein
MVGGGSHSSGFAEGGCDVPEIDEIIHYAPAFHLRAPAHGHGDVERIFINLPFYAREGHAVIGGRHDQRVVELADFLEFFEDQAQMMVHPLDFEGVIQEIPPDHRAVRVVLGQHNFFGVSPRAKAGIQFISAVRLVRAQPEAERRAFGPLRQEVLEVAGVVAGRDPVIRGLEGSLLEFLAGRIMRPAGGLVVARSPTFTGEADPIAGFLQHIRVDGEFVGENAQVVHRLLQLPGVSAGQNAGSRGRTFGVRSETVGEQDAFPRQAVEGRSFDPLGSVSPRVAFAPIVRNEEKNVRAFGRLPERGAPQCRNGHCQRSVVAKSCAGLVKKKIRFA